MHCKALIAATVLAGAAALGPVSAPASAQQQAAATMLEDVLAHDRRADDRVRDQYRHPAETLAFFRVEPGMTVVDYMPATGWYTRVLVPYLGPEGRYIGLNPDPANASGGSFADYFAQLPGRFAEAYPAGTLAGAPVTGMGSQDISDEMHGMADRVLIFREMHNLHRSGALHNEMNRVRSLLKEDGLLGIVQHRAKPWAAGDYTDGTKAYMRQSDVVGLVEAHGFELVATSEVNANPQDPADWEDGSWNLPPVNRGVEEGTAEYERRQAIGESDRMTLLFRKR